MPIQMSTKTSRTQSRKAASQPRELAGLHEEASPAALAMTVDGYDLAGDCLGGVRRHSPASRYSVTARAGGAS